LILAAIFQFHQFSTRQVPATADDKIEFTSGLNIDEKAKMADEKTHASTRLVFILDGEYSEGVSSRAKYAAKHLAEIASIVRLTFRYWICQIH